MSTWPRTNAAAAVRCAFFLAALAQGQAWGAFAIAPGEEERVARGEQPSFLTAMERARRIGQTTQAAPRPRTELCGLLISRSRPVSAEEQAPALGRQPARDDGDEGGILGERGTVLLLIVALAGLSFAAYRCFRHRLKERT